MSATPQPEESDEPTAGVIAPPPLIFLSGLALAFGLEALLPSASIPGALSWPLGALLVVCGLVLLRTFLTSFHRAGTAVEPWKPTSAIVTSGPYRLTRNPAYLGMALTYAGIALLAKALWPFATLLVVLALIDRGVIAREERYLEREFGDEYRRYKATVRRWI
jgi:protein-S-isoprenylcysteine O-methyltransferase Ste14